jgi:hypothetical protein
MVRLNCSFDAGDVAGISECLFSVSPSPLTLGCMFGQVFGGIIETPHSVESLFVLNRKDLKEPTAPYSAKAARKFLCSENITTKTRVFDPSIVIIRSLQWRDGMLQV